jgi:hypothetical protein
LVCKHPGLKVVVPDVYDAKTVLRLIVIMIQYFHGIRTNVMVIKGEVQKLRLCTIPIAIDII